jgi:hypothetical protein
MYIPICVVSKEKLPIAKMTGRMLASRLGTYAICANIRICKFQK